ncbi:AAA family ATPase [Shewanella surugensis]|uniref:AAA family ATPase n=1 Tax=Shewanella surugensis TaxID=212020 RepID=A0ABT0LG25_9GAMM|nr:AAA family ATPase [Shewanella surugensis]MCL1126519.1 AAA family ATPase [Shewanella surugensis]
MKKLKAWLLSLKQGATPDFYECLLYLGDYFPLLRLFEATEQDKQWHGEVNVAIHTDSVLTALYQLLANEAYYLSAEQQQVLILSALLHDIGKPVTTKRKHIQGAERVIAPQYEELGLNYLAIKLLELPLPHKVMVQIMGLVGYHQKPKLLVVKNSDFSDYLALALNADLELLYWLDRANCQGQLCDDLDKQLDTLAQFKMFAEEYQLWRVDDPTAALLAKVQVKSNTSEQLYLDNYVVSELISGKIIQAEEAVATTYERAQAYSHLYVMCGISGSGKSTWIAQNLQGVEVISLDDIRHEINGKRSCQKNLGQVLQLAKSRLKNALADKRDVVWDATNIRSDHRNVICDFGRDYGALITLVVFHLKESTLRAGNQQRSHAIPNEVITRQIAQWQWPSMTEAHRILIVGESCDAYHIQDRIYKQRCAGQFIQSMQIQQQKKNRSHRMVLLQQGRF